MDRKKLLLCYARFLGIAWKDLHAITEEEYGAEAKSAEAKSAGTLKGSCAEASSAEETTETTWKRSPEIVPRGR